MQKAYIKALAPMPASKRDKAVIGDLVREISIEPESSPLACGISSCSYADDRRWHWQSQQTRF